MDDVCYAHSRALPHVSVLGSVPQILKIIKHKDLCKLHPGIESGTSPVERYLRVCSPLHHVPDECNQMTMHDTRMVWKLFMTEWIISKYGLFFNDYFRICITA